MKRLLVLVLLVLATLMGAAANASAQTAADCSPYQVRPGDTLWAKEGPQWERLIETNPWLRNRIDRRSADDVIALIYPYDALSGRGDTLCLPSGIQPSDVIRSANPPAPTPPALAEANANAAAGQGPTVINVAGNLGWWLFLIAALVLATIVGMLLYGAYRRRKEAEEARQEAERIRELRVQEAARIQREREAAYNAELARPVETAGPPMVAGGIAPTETDRLRNFFQQQAANRFAELRPNYAGTGLIERIGPIQYGMIGGEGDVRDIEGNWHPRRVDPAQPGYQARFRYPDGSEEVMQAFEICMNIVRRGEGMRGFTFTPRAQDADVVPAVQTAGTARHPHAAMQLVRTEAAEQGLNSYRSPKGELLLFEQGIEFSHDSQDPSVLRVASRGGVRIDVHTKTAAEATAAGPQATRTGTE